MDRPRPMNAALPSGRSWVERPHLGQRFDAVKPGGVGLVVAPAGSGKSVAMAQWAGAQSQPVGWVELAAMHNDAVVLAGALSGAMQRVHEDFDPSVAAAVSHGGVSLGRAFCEAFNSEMAALSTDVVFVLDDAHRLTGRQLADDLEYMLLTLPANVRCLVGSRWDPLFAAGRLRLADPVGLRSAELAFSQLEAVDLVADLSGKPITAQHATVLVDRTDGWAAGLQLAAISMQRADDVQAFVDSFAGDDRLVVDYLTEEVLRHQPDDLKQFLLRTSILDWLTPELCDAVTGSGDAIAMLDDLERRSMFIVSGDATPSRARRRYHHLFADLLRYRLRVEHPDLEAQLRMRAANWLAAHDDVGGAVGQHVAAHDWHGAFELIHGHGYRFYERGEAATLVEWLGILRTELSTMPTVLIDLLAAQMAADRFTEADETYRQLMRMEGLTTGERTVADAVRTIAAWSDLPTAEVRRAATRVLEALPDLHGAAVVDFLGVGGVDSMRTIANFMTSLADPWDGDLPAAAARLSLTLDLPGTRYPDWRVNVLGGFAMVRAWQGHVPDAERLAMAAIHTAHEAGAPDHFSTTLAHLTLAMASLDRLDLNGADLRLADAAHCADGSQRACLHHLWHLLNAGRVELVSGPEAGLAALRDSMPAGLERPLLADARLALEARLLLVLGATDEAAAVLSRCHLAPSVQRFDLLLAVGDVAGARSELDAWSCDAGDGRDSVTRELRAAVLEDHEGRPGRAGARLGVALGRAETAKLRRPFIECPAALAVLRRSTPRRRTGFGDSIIETSNGTRRVSANDQLVVPLSERELSVLAYLPTRLSNKEMAETFYVSVNTVKTHLRSIYSKLGVADRDGAVVEATRLGLSEREQRGVPTLSRSPANHP